jgi:hypothetical protein
MFGSRTRGSLFHSDKNAFQTPGDPEKEVYGGNSIFIYKNGIIYWIKHEKAFEKNRTIYR